jgi:hypothetical protein
MKIRTSSLDQDDNYEELAKNKLPWIIRHKGANIAYATDPLHRISIRAITYATSSSIHLPVILYGARFTDDIRRPKHDVFDSIISTRFGSSTNSFVTWVAYAQVQLLAIKFSGFDTFEEQIRYYDLNDLFEQNMFVGSDEISLFLHNFQIALLDSPDESVELL